MNNVSKAQYFRNSGFTLFELFLAVTLSSVLLMQMMRVALNFEFELKRQQQQMALIQRADFVARELRAAIHAAGKAECLPGAKVPAEPYELLPNGFKVWICFKIDQHIKWLPVAYYQSNGNLYRKPENFRAERLISGVSQFITQKQAPNSLSVVFTLNEGKSSLRSTVISRIQA